MDHEFNDHGSQQSKALVVSLHFESRPQKHSLEFRIGLPTYQYTMDVASSPFNITEYAARAILASS